MSRPLFVILIVCVFVIAGCAASPAAAPEQPATAAAPAEAASEVSTAPAAPAATPAPTALPSPTDVPPTVAPTATASVDPTVIAPTAVEPTPAPKPITMPVVPAPSLKANLVGEPDSHQALVYLPPSYFTDPNKRFPVVYYLAGFGSGYMEGYTPAGALMDAIEQGQVGEVILVATGGDSVISGGFYANSPVTGNWEDYVARDLVSYVDANYRTVAGPEARGIMGHSMGGYGALNAAMKHPDVFGAVYAISPGLFDANGLAESQMFADEGMIARFIDLQAKAAGAGQEEVSQLLAGAGGDLNFTAAYGLAFSPDPAQPALIAYPFKMEDGKPVRDERVWASWESGYGGVAQEAQQYKDNWLKLKGIGVDCGTRDGYKWIPKGCAYFEQQMKAAGIPVTLNLHDGGHEDRLKERIAEYALPFFDKLLSSGS